MTGGDPREVGPFDDPGLTDQLAAAAKKSGLGGVTPGETPTGVALLAAIGGIRGLVETIVPGLAFVVIFTITGLLVPAVVAPLALALVFVVVRVVQKQPYSQTLGGVLGIGLSAGIALITGRAEDNFVAGFIVNGAILVALLVSALVRWPLLGVIAGLLTSTGSTWRVDKAKRRVAYVTTFLWAGLFALRLGVQLPLYFAGEVTALGALKLVLGLPLYAAVLWVTWLLSRAAYSRQPDAP